MTLERSQYRFCGYALDASTRELLCDGIPVAIPPRVLQLILLLVHYRDRAVSNEELLQALWSGRRVTANALAQTVAAARQAVGDTGDEQRIIRTLRGFGYRFVAKVDAASGAVHAGIDCGSEPLVVTAQTLHARRVAEWAADRAARGSSTLCLTMPAYSMSDTEALIHEFRGLDSERFEVDCAHRAATEALLRELCASCSSRAEGDPPATLMIHNLQLIDPALVSLLDALLSDTAQRRVCGVATMSAARLDPLDPLAVVVHRLGQHGSAWVMAPRLELSEVRQQLLDRTGLVTDQLAARVWAVTGGVPCFVHELLAGADAASIEIKTSSEAPVAVTRAIQRRLGTLAPATRSLLRTLALAGPSFSERSLVLAWHSRPAYELAAAIDSAIMAGLIDFESDTTGYRFTSGFVQRVVVASEPAAQWSPSAARAQ